MSDGNNQNFIPAFTQNDFLYTPDPYKYLYEFKDDKFVFTQMREQMKVYAASIGVKGFVSLWNAYLEAQEKKTGVKMDNATNFEGQELELYSGPYVCDEYGVTTVDRYGYDHIICKHPIMPIRRLVNIDTNEERLEIAYKKGYAWRSLIVEKSTIASSTSILQLAAKGVLVNSENAKDLSTYLLDMEQFNYEALPENKSVSRLGWITDKDFSPYVEDIVFDGDQNFRTMYGAVKSKGDYQKWLDVMRDLRSERGVGRIFLAASFASVLLKPMGILPFFVHAYGETEVGKTVGLMIAASVWADPRVGEYITTFNSTVVGQEMTAIFLNNLPMCIDELQIQEASGIKDSDSIIYKLCEGKGKIRGTKTGGLQSTGTWQNCFISTGERPITNHNSKGGALNRSLEFEVAEPIYKDLRGLCEIITQNYGHAGRRFIELFQQKDALDAFKLEYKWALDQMKNHTSMEKQAASIALIVATDSVLTSMIFEDENILTVDDFVGIMKNPEDVSANKRALDYLLELPARYPGRFTPDKFNEYGGECWGKIDNGYLYLIKSVFDREMSENGYNPTLFLSWARRKNLLAVSNDGNNRRTVVTRIGEKTVRCIAVKANDLQ